MRPRQNSFAILPRSVTSKTEGLVLAKTTDRHDVFCLSAHDFTDSGGLFVFLKGYVVPRNGMFSSYRQYAPLELIETLYLQYGKAFTGYIKGNFVIVIIEDYTIRIFTDHFGLNGCFYRTDHNDTALSDSIDLLRYDQADLALDEISLATKSLLHRNIPGFTVYKGVFRTTPAAYILIEREKRVFSNYWTPNMLLPAQPGLSGKTDFVQYADLVKTNFHNFVNYLTPRAHSITLTGGKDSRTGLAALKSLGISPFGFTYGNKGSKDAVYAAKLAKKISVEHHVFTPPDSDDWFCKIADEIIGFGNPEISVHRGHRLAAFKQMKQLTGPGAAYYAGYMAGEFLIGVYYDNLIFTRFLTDFWETSVRQAIGPVLKRYFHRPESVHPDEVLERIYRLNAFAPNLSKEIRQFNGMFEVGVPHHCQDIFLAGQFFDYVYPFFVDIDFLEALFSGSYSFLSMDDKTINPLERYKLYVFNLNLQHLLCPEMDDVPFGKRGFYSTSEFLRGRVYWTLVKVLRYLLKREKYPESFEYGAAFKKFLANNLIALQGKQDNILHQFYDIPLTMAELSTLPLPSAESPLHKFSNIVMLYRQLDH